MSNLEEPCFIYMDNADDPKLDLREYFPRSTYARILITTRLRESEQNYGTGRGSEIHLGPLKENQAVELLLVTSRLDEGQFDNDTVQIIVRVSVLLIPKSQRKSHVPHHQELCCHALAIAQAGAAIFKAQWTEKEYLDRFQRLRTRLMDGTQDRVGSKALDGYPLHVYTTWKLSYDQLSEFPGKLLAICAHLHHNGITEDMFERAFQGLSFFSNFNFRKPPTPFLIEEPDGLCFLEHFATEGVWSTDHFRHCIQEVCSFSLLSFDQSTRTYSVHPLVHDFLRSAVAPHPSQAAFLLAATTQPIWDDQVRASALVPHVQQLLSCWPDWQDINTAVAPYASQITSKVTAQCRTSS